MTFKTQRSGTKQKLNGTRGPAFAVLAPQPMMYRDFSVSLRSEPKRFRKSAEFLPCNLYRTDSASTGTSMLNFPSQFMEFMGGWILGPNYWKRCWVANRWFSFKHPLLFAFAKLVWFCRHDMMLFPGAPNGTRWKSTATRVGNKNAFRSHPMHQNQFQSCYEELHPKVQQVTTLRHLSKATRHPLNISKHPETVLKPFLPLHPTFQYEFALELPRISKSNWFCFRGVHTNYGEPL